MEPLTCQALPVVQPHGGLDAEHGLPAQRGGALGAALACQLGKLVWQKLHHSAEADLQGRGTCCTRCVNSVHTLLLGALELPASRPAMTGSCARPRAQEMGCHAGG